MNNKRTTRNHSGISHYYKETVRSETGIRSAEDYYSGGSFKSQKMAERRTEACLLKSLCPTKLEANPPRSRPEEQEWRLMVTNLPSHASETDLAEALLELSPPLRVKRLELSRAEEMKITNEEFGYLTFGSLEDKLRLLFLQPGVCLKNQLLEFEEPIPQEMMRKRMERQRQHQVYVRGLNKRNGQESVLREFFETFGPVKLVDLAKHFKSGRFLGFAHIEFYHKNSVSEVLRGKDQVEYTLNGKRIICKRKLLKVEIDKTRGAQLIKEKYMLEGRNKENSQGLNSQSDESRKLKNQYASDKKPDRKKSSWNINIIKDQNGFIFEAKTPRKASWSNYDHQKTTTSKKEKFPFSNFSSLQKEKDDTLSNEISSPKKTLNLASPLFKFPPPPLEGNIRPKAFSNNNISAALNKEVSSKRKGLSPLLGPPSNPQQGASYFHSMKATNSKSQKYSIDGLSFTSIPSRKTSSKNTAPQMASPSKKEGYFNLFKGCKSDKLESLIKKKRSCEIREESE